MNAPTGRLLLNVEPVGDGVVIEVEGDVDPHTADQLDAEVERALVAGFPRIVLDLRHVGFLDSSGLRVLVRANEDVRRHRRRLSVRAPSVPVQRVLDLTGLTDVIEIVE